MTSILLHIFIGRNTLEVIFTQEILGIIASQFLLQGSVSKYHPFLSWNDNLKLERCSDTWLIKAREPSVAEEWLQMGVKVDLVVLRVLESMQTC
jgi:hypothetical protein